MNPTILFPAMLNSIDSSCIVELAVRVCLFADREVAAPFIMGTVDPYDRGKECPESA